MKDIWNDTAKIAKEAVALYFKPLTKLFNSTPDGTDVVSKGNARKEQSSAQNPPSNDRS